MIHFGSKLTNQEIKVRIEELTQHKVIKEIGFLLNELKRRKERFRFRIFTEMMIKE